MTTEIIEKDLISLKVLLLDDEAPFLENFESELKQFNAENPHLDITCIPTIDTLEAMKLLHSGKINVFLCDQNMKEQPNVPASKGLKLWEHIVKYEDEDGLVKKNVLFILYTTFSPAISKTCQERGLGFVPKEENFEMTLGNIVRQFKARFKVYTPDIPSVIKMYDEYAEQLINDLEHHKNTDFKFFIGRNSYDAVDMQNEIKARSTVGVKLVNGFIDGMAFVKRKRK